MDVPREVTTAADRARGLRRYINDDGYVWTVPRKKPRKPFPGIPDGFHEITIKAFTNGRDVVIPEQEGLWLPDDYDPESEDAHNCDANGCGIEHVLVRLRILKNKEESESEADSMTRAHREWEEGVL